MTPQIRTLGAGILAIAVLFSAGPTLDASAKKYVQGGNQKFFKLDYAGALKKYLEADEKLKKDDREYAIGMLNIATAYWKLGQYDKVVEYLDKASEKIWGPKSGWQSMNLGFGTGVMTNESKQEWIGTENERMFLRFYAAMSTLQMGNVDEALIGFKLCNKISENYGIERYFHGYASSLVPEERENALVHVKAAALAASGIKEFVKDASPNPFPALRLATLSARNDDSTEAEAQWALAAPGLAGNPLLAQKDAVLKNGTNLMVLIERGWSPVNAKDKTRSFPNVKIKIDGAAAGDAAFLDYSGKHEKIGTSEAMKGFAAAMTTELGKEAMKNVAGSVIPGGGLVLGLFMGGKRDRSVATWDKIPPAFYLYETHLAPGAHKVTVELWDGKGQKKGVEMVKDVTVTSSGASIVNIAMAIKK